jgi:hypothetical protein
MHLGTDKSQRVCWAVKETVEGKWLSGGPASTTNSMEPDVLLSSISSIVHSTQFCRESNLQSPLQEFTVGALNTPEHKPCSVRHYATGSAKLCPWPVVHVACAADR